MAPLLFYGCKINKKKRNFMKNGEKKTVFYPFFSIIMPFRIFNLRFLTHMLV